MFGGVVGVEGVAVGGIDEGDLVFELCGNNIVSMLVGRGVLWRGG